jgi:hypothetical protein
LRIAALHTCPALDYPKSAARCRLTTPLMV